MVEGVERRSRSTSIPPAPNFPPPTHPPVSDRWAEVLFNFTAEYPDELTIDVSLLNEPSNVSLVFQFIRGMIGSRSWIKTPTSWGGG